jgi:hypothetical protein
MSSPPSKWLVDKTKQQVVKWLVDKTANWQNNMLTNGNVIQCIIKDMLT